MKRLFVVSLMLAILTPAVALAKSPTQQHVHQYQRLYHTVAHRFGTRAPGRNIVRDGVRHGTHVRPATDADVTRSVGELRIMLAPPPAPVAAAAAVPAPQAASTTYTAAPATVAYTAPSTGLAGCIVSRESGGNTQAVNGQYSGIAQWSPSSWANGGGTKYSSSPTGATYSQQMQVLNSMLANGQASQWTPYDGC